MLETVRLLAGATVIDHSKVMEGLTIACSFDIVQSQHRLAPIVQVLSESNNQSLSCFFL